jgi:hypothetical protein
LYVTSSLWDPIKTRVFFAVTTAVHMYALTDEDA